MNWAVGWLAVAMGGCTTPDPTPKPAPSTSAEDELRQQLESLGYIDVSDDAADPSQMGVTLHDTAAAWPGHNLYCMKGLAQALLLDMDGSVVHQWSPPVDTGAPTDREWTSCRLANNGDLIVIGVRENTLSNGIHDGLRFIARYSWDGTERWRKARVRAHHDSAQLPNGDTLTLQVRYRQVPELDTTAPIRDDLLVRIAPDGTVVEQHSLLDALRAAPRPLISRAPEDKWNRVQVDLVHANTVAPITAAHDLFSPGQVLITSRHQQQVFALDLHTGQVTWAWGPGVLRMPHEGAVLDNGNVLIFDNGDEARPHSRIVELQPTASGGEVVWSWTADPPSSFHSDSRGGAQRLPNGNTLVTESNRGHVFELSPAGTIVWEFWNPVLARGDHRRTFRRMERIPLSLTGPLLSGLVGDTVPPTATPQAPGTP